MSFETALSGQLVDEFGPGGIPAGLQAATALMGFLSNRMPYEEFRMVLTTGHQEIRSRLETAARTYRYDGVVPALTLGEAGMLVCCSAGAVADLADE
ncbi:hypothetical protein [Streptomyces sp. NPDC006463]|uniref:hypothetical protein n=1 Tax=Streptomyces sp. NPDC006463 TaxID=3364746 RepID=UPI0036C6D278